MEAPLRDSVRQAPHESRFTMPDPTSVVPSEPAVPIYEYVCMECESHFEELVRNGETVSCPDCGGSRVSKQLSVFAAHGTAAQPSFGGTGGGCCGGGCGCAH